MTPLMFMITWLLQAPSVTCELPAPINLNISSHHFVHLLTWQPGPASPTDLYYNVSITSLKSGASWEPVAGCEHVRDPLLCDLTQAFTDRSEVYYSMVQAVQDHKVSPQAMTEGFKPIQDTHLDPPVLSLRPCKRGLCVGLQPPLASLDDVYGSLSYKLTVVCRSMDTGQFSVVTKSLEEVVLSDLVPGTQYCVAVRIADNLERRDSADGPYECVYTTATHTPDREVAVVMCVLVVGGIGIVFILVHTGVFCLHTSLPQLLSSVEHHEKQCVTAPSSDILFFLIHVEALPPPAGKKEDSSQTSRESDEEMDDSSGGMRGNYEARPTAASTMANPLSSSSSCSSSSSSISSRAQLLPCPNPGSMTGQLSQSSDTSAGSESVHHSAALLLPDQQAELAGTSTRSSPVPPTRRPLSMHPLSGTGCRVYPPSVEVRLEPQPEADTDQRTEEDAGALEERGQEVNLLSVKLGGYRLKQGAAPNAGANEEGACPCSEEGACPCSEEGACPCSEEGACPCSEEGACPCLEEGACPCNEEGACPCQEGACPCSEEAAAMGTVSCVDTEDEDEEECYGYMKR